ncbi:ABC transporter substrate-binding protein [Nesterenkonia cremea]|uniref:ABC transporter substrate-binding protein n=1 Tax=Nesterenkonia cremea TaxID=1882340 RepID=UPI001E305E7D|nr:ABC transporter substrate-binding protein [Nesterenkonia cremea]
MQDADGDAGSDDVGASGGAAASVDVALENCGQNLEFDTAPQRVVGMSPAQTELLVRLGQGDRVVGVAQTASSELPEEVSAELEEAEELSEDRPPSREELLQVEPDFVYAPTSYEFSADQGFASIDQLEEAGAASYIATGGCFERRSEGTVEDLFTDIENLGEILAAEEAAEEIIDDGRGRLEDAAELSEGSEPLSVAQVYVDGDTLSAVGGGVEYDIIAQAGGENVFSPEEDQFDSLVFAQISAEELSARNPEAIVFGAEDAAHEEATRKYLTENHPEIEAVQEDRLISVPNHQLLPGSLQNIDAVERVADGLYGG